MANIMRKIMKYKWILASLLVIYLFFHFFMRTSEGFNCSGLKDQTKCRGQKGCSWNKYTSKGAVGYRCQNA